MSLSGGSPQCRRCGLMLPPGVATDECPGCLLAAGLQPPSARGAFVAPETGELQPLFPELEIVALLGQGGMGAVYKVRQPALDRFAALKVLPVESDERPGFRQRFQREARTLAALNHPHIVTVYDFGERQGHFYFLMEFVDGGDLGALIRTKVLGSRQAMGIVPQICEALQYAHDAQVVHRDIKPGNILIDALGRVKIADFGVAKLLGHTDAGVPSDYVLGTPHYMAPEQHDRPIEVDHRADLYSLGVVFYEMLTGELPRGKFEPPSRRVAVDVRIDEVVLRALENDPTRRYQHASEIKEHVERVLAPPRRDRRWPALAGGLATAGIAAAWMLRPRPVPPPEPVDPFPPVLENSLGMRFRPVPGTPALFSIWETRVKDWDAFGREGAPILPPPPFEQAPDHPQTGVSLDAAEAFCRWLTKKERAAGELKANELYRLPTDEEWSLAVGLEEPEAASPAERHLNLRDQYPWGTLAPVPPAAGNYPDRALKERVQQSLAVAGYYDGFVTTSPVGHFKPNPFGLFDLGGNVWEVTSSPFAPDKPWPVLRGGAWDNAAATTGWDMLLSSFRAGEAEQALGPSVLGFRIVRATAEAQNPSLLAAVRDGNAEAVRTVLGTATADLSAKDVFGRTALVLAVRGAQEEIASLLLEAGADPNTADAVGATPLHEAARAGSVALVKQLVAKGARMDAKARNGLRPLDHAAGSGSLPVLETLVAAGAEISPTGAPGSAPLAEALWNRQTAAALWLLDHGVDLQPAKNSSAPSPLITACITGDHQVVARLLALGVPSDGDVAGMSTLSLAAWRAEPDIVRLLIDHGADASDPMPLLLACLTMGSAVDLASHGEDSDGAGVGSIVNPASLKRLVSAVKAAFTPFTLAGRTGQRAEVIRLLVEKGAPLEGKAANGMTPLLFASWMGEREAVQALLDAGADAGAIDREGFTALHSAIEHRFPEIVDLLIARGAKVDARTTDGRTTLGIAAAAGATESVEILLRAGAAVDGRISGGPTPLEVAASGGWIGVVESLLRHGADPNAASADSPWSALHLAAGGLAAAAAQERAGKSRKMEMRSFGPSPDRAGDGDYVRCVRMLLDHGASPAARTTDGSEPLHIASQFDAEESAVLLLDHGAAIEAADVEFRTPLHYAAMGNAARTAKLLLERGAILNPLLVGSSTLHTAASNGSVEVAELLREQGADLDAANAQSATPLLLAIHAGQPRMVAWLIEVGADLEKRDAGWMTPLHRAVHTGTEEIVRLLCQKGANLDARDAASATPLHYSVSLNKPQIRALLLNTAAARRQTAPAPPPPK